MGSGVLSSASLPSLWPRLHWLRLHHRAFQELQHPTPLSTPPHTRGGTPEIDIVSASGRGSPARWDVTMRQAVFNAQLREMLNDLRNQTDKLMRQQNRANEAIEALQNRPPVQLPPVPVAPRRSPYAALLSQISDTLRNSPADDETERAVSLQPASSGSDLDLLRLLQDKRKQRRGGDGTFIPGGDEAVEDYMVRLIILSYFI
jgi:hypothetical protein